MDTKVLKSEVVLVTPEIAKLFLTKNNSGNRRINKARVESLAHSLKKGEWVLSHQGIGFCENGDLLDGQHRLTAIVEAGIPAQLLVTYGLPVSSFKVMDCGYKRSISDRSGLSRSVSEVCSFFVKNSRKKGFGYENAISVDDVMKVYDYIGDTIQELLEFAPTMTKILTSAPCRAAAVISSMRENKEYVFDLYRKLSIGETINLPNAGHAIVKQVLNGNIITGGGYQQVVTYSRMRIVFNEKNKDLMRIVISDAAIDKYKGEIVEIFAPLLDGSKQTNPL